MLTFSLRVASVLGLTVSAAEGFVVGPTTTKTTTSLSHRSSRHAPTSSNTSTTQLRVASSPGPPESLNSKDGDVAAESPRSPPLRRGSKSDAVVMSTALPFLRCPEPLVDCPYAGNFGFDPLRLASSPDQLAEYREAEIKHCRLAMLAAVGWPLSELWDRKVASFLSLDPLLDGADRVPSLLNGGLDRVSPAFWGFCLGLTAAIDLYGVSKSRQASSSSSYFPGKLGFDPLGLYPNTLEGRQRVELAEIKHGRLAMMAVMGYAAQEYATSLGVVDETPYFFFFASSPP